MKLLEKYKIWDIRKRVLFWLVFIGLAGTVIFLPFCLFSNPGFSLGFFLGSIIEIACYLLLCVTGDTIANNVKGTAKNGLVALSSFGFIIRFALYAGGLVLGAFATFVWKSNWLSIWTVFVAYMPQAIVLACVTLKDAKKNQ